MHIKKLNSLSLAKRVCAYVLVLLISVAGISVAVPVARAGQWSGFDTSVSNPAYWSSIGNGYWIVNEYTVSGTTGSPVEYSFTGSTTITIDANGALLFPALTAMSCAYPSGLPCGFTMNVGANLKGHVKLTIVYSGTYLKTDVTPAVAVPTSGTAVLECEEITDSTWHNIGVPTETSPLALSVLGSTSGATGTTQTWTATAIYGITPYHYVWTDNGSPVGADSSALTLAPTVSGLHVISCTVTDSTSTMATNTISTTVLPSENAMATGWDVSVMDSTYWSIIGNGYWMIAEYTPSGTSGGPSVQGNFTGTKTVSLVANGMTVPANLDYLSIAYPSMLPCALQLNPGLNLLGHVKLSITYTGSFQRSDVSPVVTIPVSGTLTLECDEIGNSAWHVLGDFTDPVPLKASVTGTTSLGDGTSGSWTVVPAHGTPPYQYAWADNGTPIGGNTSVLSSVLATAGAHTISCTVTDSVLTTTTGTMNVTVIVPNALNGGGWDTSIANCKYWSSIGNGYWIVREYDDTMANSPTGFDFSGTKSATLTANGTTSSPEVQSFGFAYPSSLPAYFQIHPGFNVSGPVKLTVTYNGTYTRTNLCPSPVIPVSGTAIFEYSEIVGGWHQIGTPTETVPLGVSVTGDEAVMTEASGMWTAAATGGIGAYHYSWTDDGLPVGVDSETLTATLSLSGTHTISCTVTDDLNTTATATQTVQVTPGDGKYYLTPIRFGTGGIVENNGQKQEITENTNVRVRFKVTNDETYIDQPVGIGTSSGTTGQYYSYDWTTGWYYVDVAIPAGNVNDFEVKVLFVNRGTPGYFHITASSTGNGTVTPADEYVKAGSTIYLNVTPNGTDALQSFTDNGIAQVGVDSVYTLTNVQGDHTIAAAFSGANLVTLFVQTTGSGTVTVSPQGTVLGPNTYAFAAGTTVFMTPVPNASATFIQWNTDASGSGAPLSLTLDTSKTVGAEFDNGGPLCTVTLTIATTADVLPGIAPYGAFGTGSVLGVSFPMADVPMNSLVNIPLTAGNSNCYLYALMVNGVPVLPVYGHAALSVVSTTPIRVDNANTTIVAYFQNIGDLNLDGKVGILDLNIICTFSFDAGKPYVQHEPFVNRHSSQDINRDGIVNLVDASLLLGQYGKVT